MPKAPEWLSDKPGYILGGWFYRYARRCIQGKLTPEILAQFAALMNVKRAGTAISEQKQLASMVKHVKNMRGAEYNPSPVIVNFTSDWDDAVNLITHHHRPEEVILRIKERMTDLIHHDYTPKIIKPRWRVPSNRACYEYKLKHGGVHALFERDLACLSMQFVGYAECGYKVYPIYVPYVPEDLLEDCKDMYRSRDRAPIRATVHRVLEPFKCRIITAGEGVPYQLGRILQKDVHSQMRRQKMFQLTGAPVTADYMNHLYGDAILLKEGENIYNDGGVFEFDSERDGKTRYQKSFFVAGDYSAATDGMHPELSLHFVDVYSRIAGLDNLFTDVMRQCMEGHILYYPELKEEFIEPLRNYISGYHDTQGIVVEQSWGQLMGSPLSFPILCYANAAVNWVSADLYHGEKLEYDVWTSSYRPCFNGDDTSFLSNRSHYKVWKAVASCAGLNSSLGKSYCSPDFQMINSELFWSLGNEYLKSGVQDVFVLNPGLVKGQAKVLGDTRKNRENLDGEFSSSSHFLFSDNKIELEKRFQKEAPSRYGELLPMVDQLECCKRKCSVEQGLIVDDLFFDHILDRLKEVPRPWSLPRCMGGLGLRIGSPNYSQRKLAARYLMEDLGGLSSYEKQVPRFQLCANAHVDEVYRELEIIYRPRELSENKYRWSALSLSPVDYRILTSLYGCDYVHKIANHKEEGSSKEYDFSNMQEQFERNKKGLSLDIYYIGAELNGHGEDRYGNLLKETLSYSWVNPISDELVERLHNYSYRPRCILNSVYLV
jgi:hypothetical protein